MSSVICHMTGFHLLSGEIGTDGDDMLRRCVAMPACA